MLLVDNCDEITSQRNAIKQFSDEISQTGEQYIYDVADINAVDNENTQANIKKKLSLQFEAGLQGLPFYPESQR